MDIKRKKYSKKEFERDLKKYDIDTNTSRVFSDSTVRRELYGCYNDSRNTSVEEFKQWRKNTLQYGANHMLQMSKYIQKKDNILELAAANGWASALLRSLGYKKILVTDINPFDFNGLSGIKRLSKHKIATRIMSFETIDLPDNNYNIVFMCSSLHHSSNVGNVAKQVHDKLKKKGKWFIMGEPIRGMLDPKNKSMEHSNDEGFNDNFYYWWHYRKEIKNAGFDIRVLFPIEFDKMLSGEISDNCQTRYKKWLLSLAKYVYKNSLGKKIIQKIYPISLYFIGSHSVIMCTKK